MGGVAVSAFTPGPWFAQERETGRNPAERGIGVIADNLGGMVAWLGDSGANWRDTDTQKANAKLIAAAPDLLAVVEALLAKRLIDGKFVLSEDSQLVKAARDAYAKAAA